MAEARLRVTPDILKAKAQDVETEVRKIASAFEQLSGIIGRTSYYWIGDAGNRHRQQYQEQKEQIAEHLVRLKDHPGMLLKMAQVYEATESDAIQVGSSLPIDIFE